MLESPLTAHLPETVSNTCIYPISVRGATKLTRAYFKYGELL